MLKIRDDVDLKELEKFGFKPKYDVNTGEIEAYEKQQSKHEWLGLSVRVTDMIRTFRIFKKTKKEWRINPYNQYFDVDLLFDLIQADLVEKVDD